MNYIVFGFICVVLGVFWRVVGEIIAARLLPATPVVIIYLIAQLLSMGCCVLAFWLFISVIGSAA